MQIQSGPILAQFTQKTRQHGRDASRHILCPSCQTRTKLYSLADGRKKCSVCDNKFQMAKRNDQNYLQQLADILLCFCLDFSAQQTATLTGASYHFVAKVFDAYRHVLAEQNLSHDKIHLFLKTETGDRSTHDSVFCQHCAKRFSCKGRQTGDAPVFGVKFLPGGRVFLEPLEESETVFNINPPLQGGQFAEYAGYICRNKFHRFKDNAKQKDGAEQLWGWMHERLQRHHGIRKVDLGLYLKELEWKYNNRSLTPQKQAMKIAAFVPEHLLVKKRGLL